jgi:cytochrome b6
MSARRPLIQFIQALTERVPLEKASFEELIVKKEVPRHRMSWAYYLGGLALFFLLIQFVTGLMLLFYYLPTVSDANASMEFIEKYVSGADFIRNMHVWSASFLVAFVVLHLLTTFAMKAYEKPREITWTMGVLLLLITFAFGFSGYLLPWTQVGVNATKVVFQSMQKTGDYLPGPLAQWPRALRLLIQGEPALGQATLSRMFALHVVVLPLLLLAILAVHLLLVQIHGMSQGVARPSGRTERFFPFFALKDFSLWGLFFFIVFILAITIPFESFYSYPLFEPYDAMGGTPDGIKPEWYFYFVYYPLEILPFWLVALLLLIVLILLFLTPAVFKSLSRRSLGAIAALAFVYLLVITIFGQPIRDLIKGGP